MPNRLANETSPYLLQHANNPVDWYPWGDEALDLAKRLDRPIFLSIGYSACHWCHVMEHESFENPEIAALMNQWFVCIKVDREERPDLDQIYMNAVTAMTGSGGWPMSVFLTPQCQPFYGGTYWPPTARWNRPGFREILARIQDAWQERRDAVESQAGELTDHIIRIAAPTFSQSALNTDLLENAMRSLLKSADRVHGGFGAAPKFPHPMDLRLALRCWRRFGGKGDGVEQGSEARGGNSTQYSVLGTQKTAQKDVSDATDTRDEALQVVLLTLDKMARGGIYDHLGGGFARYSTDERWLVPHFEKMLYDNALLVPAYLEAYQITGRNDFARVVRETLDYVLREMTQPRGGFYATQDADSEGVEGKFFVWTEEEIDRVLGDTNAKAFKTAYDVTRHGNWEHSNILNRRWTHREAADALKIDPDQLEKVLAEGRKLLFDARSQRVWPGRDEKVLVSWNGLMIAAMSIAANVLSEPKYAAAASEAADFILREMVTEDGRLLHGFKDGRARFNAYLDDYAGLIDGLCELYQAVFDVRFLDAALRLTDRMLEQFWDVDEGGFFYTSTDHESLIARNKETHDNATPSGNSLAATALVKLARLTDRSDLEQKAVATLQMMSGQLEKIPMACGQALIALDLLLGPTYEISIISDDADPQSSALARASLHRRFLPNKVVHIRTGPIDDTLPASIRSALAGKSPSEGQTTMYVCVAGACGLPAVGLDQINQSLDRL